MSSFQSRIGLLAIAAALSAGAASAAQAQTHPAQTFSSAYDGGYGFAEPLVRGEYIGAPLTRAPRSYELVPSAWGYGTFGIPTVAGIRRAPIGEPIVYVIDSPAPAAGIRRSAGPRVLARGRSGRWSRMEPGPTPARPGARVVSMTVPRR